MLAGWIKGDKRTVFDLSDNENDAIRLLASAAA